MDSGIEVMLDKDTCTRIDTLHTPVLCFHTKLALWPTLTVLDSSTVSPTHACDPSIATRR